MTLWELRDGVFAKAFIRHSGLGSVLLLPLDSGESRTQVDFDTTFNALTMDLGQDLIALAGVEPDQPTSARPFTDGTTAGFAYALLPPDKHTLKRKNLC
ncbi:hypothetical protein FRC09_000822 [Ceratobasidium sp. 395]|nr:hypothetical protein FRC09_000822 [Ceratobasidium sp. 395]